MARTKMIKNSVKYTIVIPESDIEQLKELSEKHFIDSVNAGVREAVEDYLIKIKKDLYKKELSEAGTDETFLKRTGQTMAAYKHADQETEEMIPEW